MDSNTDDNKKKITMLQQAEKYLNHGHSLLYQRDKKRTKHNENQHQVLHHPSIESLVESRLPNSMELKLNEMIDNRIESLLEQNSIKLTMKCDQKNPNTYVNTKTNENHNVSLCNNEVPNNNNNNNNDIYQLIIKNQNIIMERFDELDTIKKNEMKQMEQNVDKIQTMISDLNQMVEVHEKQINELNVKIEQNQSELIKDINYNLEGISDRMESIENNIKETNEKLDGTTTYRNASTLESSIDVKLLEKNSTTVNNGVDVNESGEDIKPNEDETSIINTQDDRNCNDGLFNSMIKHVTTSDETNTIPINVVKNKRGKVLFVESNVEFIRLLRLLQNIPIGILSQTIQHHNPFNILRMSLQNLPNDLFGLSKDDGSISTTMTMTDLEHLGLPSVGVTLETGGSMDCKGSGSGPYICTGRTHDDYKNGVAFCGLGRSFEIALVVPKDYPADILLGILPDDSNLSYRCTTKRVFENHGFFLYPHSSGGTWPDSNKNYPEIFKHTDPKEGKELRMRFEQEPQKLEYSYDDGPWYQVEIEKGYSIEETTQCCPVLLSCWNDCPITITQVKSLDKEKSNVSLLKCNLTFLISNELEITMNRTICQLELYQKYNVDDFSAVQISTLNFGCIELKKLITALLNGEQNILDATLKM